MPNSSPSSEVAIAYSVDEMESRTLLKTFSRAVLTNTLSSAPQGLLFSLHILRLSGGIINTGNHVYAFEEEVAPGPWERYSILDNVRLVYNRYNIGVPFVFRNSRSIERISGRKPLD